MIPNPPPKLLTVQAAAECVGLSVSFLNKARCTGDGPAYVKLGARVLYLVADLAAWIESRRFAHTSQYAAAGA